MSIHPHRLKRVRAFLQIAARELRSAKLLAGESPEDALFLLQQSSEKLARALIEAAGLVAGTTHNIQTLAEILPEGHALKDSLKPVYDLSTAATRFRYPTSGGNIFEADMDVAAAAAHVEQLMNSVIDYLKNQKLT